MPTLIRSGAFSRTAFNNDAFLVDVFQEDAGQASAWQRQRLARRRAGGAEVLADLAVKPTAKAAPSYGEDDARYWEDVQKKRRARAETERKRQDAKPEVRREAASEQPPKPGLPDWPTLAQQAREIGTKRTIRAGLQEDEMIAQVVAELLMQETEIVAGLAALGLSI